MLIVEKKYGTIEYSRKEVAIFIEEQLKMIPGIAAVGKSKIRAYLEKYLGLRTGEVRISQLNVNEVLLDIFIVLKKESNYLEIKDEIKKIITYSLDLKYGLGVTSMNIHIRDMV